MTSKEFFTSGRTLAQGQRWLFEGFRIAYVAEILENIAEFKVVQILYISRISSPEDWFKLGGITAHSSLLSMISGWEYLDGQESA